MSLILCRQEPVRHPFYVERLGIHIASSQELCYVLYQNPLLVLDGFVDDRLIEFIRSELGLSFLAGKLEAWQRSGECSGVPEGNGGLLFPTAAVWNGDPLL